MKRPYFLGLVAAFSASLSLAAHAQEKFVYLTNWFAQAEHGGFYQALAQGLYKKAGLDVTLRMGGPQVNGLQLLAAGQADCYMGYDVQTMKVHEQGVRAVTVAAAFQKDPEVMIGHPEVFKKMEDLKGKTLSFGSQSSTSGHLMPRSYLLAAKINPDVDLKRVAFSGAHDATIAAVASGKVDAGALNISVWEKFVTEKKVDPAQVKVFYTTPAYYDYNWSVHADMPQALQEKIKAAFLALDPATPQGKEILGLQRATRFVPTKPENYAGIKAAAENAGLLK